MTEELTLADAQKKWHGTLRSYVIGFILSLVLTAAAFLLVVTHLFAENILIFTIVSLGFIQAVAQLLFFLHLGSEDKPRWEMLMFIFMVGVLLIIVIGSLWIMYDLNNRVMSGMTGSHHGMHHD